jgi:hypothetical protein
MVRTWFSQIKSETLKLKENSWIDRLWTFFRNLNGGKRTKLMLRLTWIKFYQPWSDVHWHLELKIVRYVPTQNFVCVVSWHLFFRYDCSLDAHLWSGGSDSFQFCRKVSLPSILQTIKLSPCIFLFDEISKTLYRNDSWKWEHFGKIDSIRAALSRCILRTSYLICLLRMIVYYEFISVQLTQFWRSSMRYQ